MSSADSEPAGPSTGRGRDRRLAAIVVADVVEYSRLMERDDLGTLEAVEALMRDVVVPTTEAVGGHIVKTLGDGWLAEFPSVTAAVSSSLDIQRSLARGADKDADTTGLALRIGVSLGEIIHADGDVYGTGVNLAARLESIARPGGVCVSDWVFAQIRNAFDLPFEDMGPQQLKNLSSRIRAFMVYPDPGHSNTADAPRPSAPREAPRASIAVLPFVNLSHDPDEEYFVDGMVDDILTALARFKWLAVIARQSSFAYKGRAVDVREVGAALGVRYVLEGSARRSEKRIRITGQLIDATTGAHVWADRFEGDLGDIFDLQDRLTESVVGVLEPQIRRAEIERARRTRPENLDAYDLFLQSLPLAYAMRPVENARALELLDEALELDPGYPPAIAFAAWCYEQRLTRAWPSVQPGDEDKAVALAHAALSVGDDDATVVSLAGFVLVMVGREYETGLAALRRAVDLNPYNVFVLMNAGWMEVFAGDLQAGTALFERARSISPADPASFFVITGLAMANLLTGRWPEAADFASESASLYPEWDATQLVLTLALAYMGHRDEAAAAAAKLRELLGPGASVYRHLAGLPLRDPARLAILEEGMTLAGLT